MKNRHNQTGRSDAEARHVRLYHWIMRTQAWKALKPLDRAVYVEIASRYNGSNNGLISFSVREAAIAMQLTKSPAAIAFKNLEDTGFIVCTTKGGFSVNNRRATEWRLTEFTCDITKQLASKEFTRWDGTFRFKKPRNKGSHTQNIVRPAGPIVSPAGQYDAASRTMVDKNRADGAAGRTINVDSTPSTVPLAGHIYVTRGSNVEMQTTKLHPQDSSNPFAAQPESPKAKSLGVAHVLETPLMKRSAAAKRAK